jgi:uncharacterized protein (TIGR02466 family)
MKNEPDQDGFIALWPTLLLRQEIPGYEVPNKMLRDLILELDHSKQDLTTDYRRQDFLQNEHPSVKWLVQCFHVSVKQYMQKQGIQYETNWSLQAWPNINRRGDYHGLHNHPHCYLSGTYYVDVPNQEASNSNRKDLAPGEISFYDPRAQANMTAVKNDPQIEAEYSILPKSGSLLVWPAWLHHFVHPNFSDEPRISVSFNVVLKRSNDYLPEQA